MKRLLQRGTVRCLISALIVVGLCRIAHGQIEGGEDAQHTVLEASLGRLILLHDRKHSHEDGVHPYWPFKIYQEFEKTFERDIKGLPVGQRVRFLWAAMWHLGFDGEPIQEFKRLVLRDCGDEFMAKLQKHISAGRDLNRGRYRLQLSETILRELRYMRQHSR